MALQKITAGLNKDTQVTNKKKFYSDIDLTFTPKAGSPDADGNFSGDLYKKVDLRAVEQAVQNILLTNTYEKPFEPSFGANIQGMLFETTANYSESMLTDRIRNEIIRWEPRAKVLDVKYYTGDTLIRSGVSSLNDEIDYTVRIVVDLQINNKGFKTSLTLNRFR